MLASLLWILAVSAPAMQQEADTLLPSRVLSVQRVQVVKPSEQTAFDGAASLGGVADAVRRFTGVQLKDYGGAGGLKTVNVRSLGSEHVGVFLDGIQVMSAQNMQVDLGRFSASGFESVALYNASRSDRLQTAAEYASGAALYLESGRPSSEGLRLRLSGGSLGSVVPSLRYDRRIGRSLMLSTQAEFVYSQGRYKYPYFDTTLVRENADLRSLRLQAQLFGRGWNVMAYTYGSERGFPGPVIRRSAGFPLSAERQADQDFFLQGTWRRDWTGRLSGALRFKYSNSYTHYNTHPELNPMAMPYNLHYRQQYAYLSAAHSYAVTNVLAVDMSTDMQYNTLDSDAGQFVWPKRGGVTAALAGRLALESFRMGAHIVYSAALDTYNSAAGGWTRQDTFRGAWMPGVSFFWSPAPWCELSGFAKGSYRLPTFNDLYYTLMGNSSLLPEKAAQYGLDFRAGASLWEIRLSPYYNRVSNKIVAIPTSSQFRWTMLNIGLADIWGLDCKAGISASAFSWLVKAQARYSLQIALDHSAPGSGTYGNQLPYIPRHSGSIELEASRSGWTVLLSSTFTGRRWSRSANTPDYCIDPWTISSAGARRRAGKWNFGLDVNNIFNTPYQIVQGYPMPGITVMLTTELNI